MKIATMIFLLLTAVFLLSGCGHYGMGMGRHFYGGVHVNQNGADLQPMPVMASVSYSR